MATSKFGSAFAAARKAGKKEFTFGGKRYTTKTKEEESKKKKSPKVPARRKDSKPVKASGGSKRGSAKPAPKKRTGHGIAMGQYSIPWKKKRGYKTGGGF